MASPQEEQVNNPPSHTQNRKTALYMLLALAASERKTLAIGTFFLLIGSGMSLLYPQGIRVVIDALSKTGTEQVIDQAVLFLSIIFVVQGIATAFRSYLFTVAGERIVTKLRQNVYSNVIVQEIGFFDTNRTGDLLNRLSSDTTALQNTASVNVSMALRYGVTVIGGVLLLLYTSTKLTLLMMVIVPPVVIGAVFFGRSIRRFSRKVQDALAKSSEIAEETISGIRTVRAFAREEQEKERYHEAVEESFHIAKKRAVMRAIFSGVVTFSAYLSIAIVLWFGGHMVIQGKMTVGTLTSFILYTLMIAVALGALAGLWADFMRAIGATQRVFELLQRTAQIPSGTGKVSSIEGHITLEGHITFSNVSFHYPSRPDIEVLRDIHLSLKAGEVLALVGPSGSGKSTIASLIPRFYDPTKGEIELDGVNLKQLDATWLRQQIGIVAQEPILFSTSIEENILYGKPTATRQEVHEAAKAANALSFIEGFPEQFATQVGERGVQLSGGQKQRIAIARAVLKNPKILILDEATSALDSESEHLVKEALDRLMEGRTTLIIAHRLSTVKDAHRVAVLDNGHIIESGTHDELLKMGGLYNRLVERQFISH